MNPWVSAVLLSLLLCSGGALFAAASTAQQAADEIHSLPGWTAPLPSRMFSGFVPCGSSQGYRLFEHYFFVESEGNPSTDPVIVWTNGGPGASSMFGLFVELGPFYLSAQSLKTGDFNRTGIPTLFRNPYSWSRLANILIINSPPPVGYSYCEPSGPAGHGDSCGTWNDTRTAVHSAAYLDRWLERFPQFGRADWYVIGESYAGVYVPTLVRQLLSTPASTVRRRLRGFAVGDGCVGADVVCGPRANGPYFHVEFFHGHGQFADGLYDRIMAECPREQLLGYGTPVTDPGCRALLAEAEAQIGGYYAYALYDACWYQNDLNPPHDRPGPLSARRYWGPPRKSTGRTARGHQSRPLDGPGPVGGALNDYPCGGAQAMFQWVQHPDVKRALHVQPDAYFFSGDNGVGFVYNLTEANLLPFYQEVVRDTKLRVLVYNGDTDPDLNTFVAQNWTRSLGFRETQPWRPWTLDGHQYMGGYVTRYAGDFDFLTIRGAGHMVPEYKPRVTFEFLSKWLAGEDWLGYKP